MLPSGPAFNAALALVADGSTAELSVEFNAIEQRIENGRRTVLKSTLPGIGIVDRGSYGAAGAVEVRRRGGRVRARVPTRHKVACECAGDCSHAIFEPGSFEIPDEVLAVAGEYKAPVASLQRGTLRLAADDEALTIDIDLPDPSENEATRRLLEAAATVGVYARPYVDARLSEYTEDGDTRTYSRAWLRAIILAPTDKVEGWEAAEVMRALAPRRAGDGGATVLAIGIHPRDLADRLAPNGEALAQDEVRSAERLTEFGAELMVRYLGASAYAALPATVADNVLLRLGGYFRDAPAVSSRAVANSRGQGREANQRPVEYGFEWSALTTRKRPPTRCANPAP